MFRRKKAKSDKAAAPPAVPPKNPALSHVKASLLSLEPRLMFDAAAAATAAEAHSEQVAQEQADAAVSQDAPSADADMPTSDSSSDVLKALSGYMPIESRHEIAFVDVTVPDYQTLLNGMDPNIEVIMLEGGQDGIAQMANALSGRTGIDAVHIISHGGEGALQLGIGILTTTSMSGQYADALATIKLALSEQADILVYGCDFALGEAGQEAVNQLAALTGADIEASSDLTGNAALGGDWDLEVQTGSIETQVAINYDTQANWLELLSLTASGSETRVNTTTSGVQDFNSAGTDWTTKSVAADATGNFITVWESAGDIYGQRYDSAGTAQGSEFVIANNAASERIASVAMNSSGAFVVTWERDQGTGDHDIYARMYNSSGTAVGSEFLVNETTSNDQAYARVAMDASGNFVVAWEGNQEAGTYYDNIFAQRYDSTGTKIGSNFLVNTTTAGDQDQVDIAMDSAGNFVVVWEGERTAGSSVYSIYGQRYDSSGKAQGGEFLVNSVASSNDQHATIAMNDSGNFVVTWDRLSGSDTDVQAQRFNSSGVAQGSAISVTSNATYNQDLANVAMDAGGNFVVSWSSLNQDGSSYGIYTRQYDNTGTALTTESRATTTTTNVQDLSGVAYQNGKIVVTWSGNGPGDSAGIFMQRYNATGGNAAPTITSNGSGGTASVSVTENTTAVTTVTATDASPGQTLTYSISGGVDAAKFTINSSTGALSFVSAPNYESPTDSGGNNVYDVIVTVEDGVGGADSQSIVVTVTNSNEAPVLADTALSMTVAEDAGAPSGAVGSLISAFTGGVTDQDSGAAKGIAITGSDQTNGTWYYTTNGGTTWTTVGTVSNTSALLLADNGSTRLYFAPSANYNGTSTAALTVRAWDQTSGTAGTKVTTASNGGTTAFSSATDTIDVTVSAVNDAPTNLALSANSVAENAANGTVIGTVTGTDPDAGDTKTYSFTDSAGGRFTINSSTGVITVADGSLLNYEAATSHPVTVRVTDSGGLTYDQSFTIQLTDVNEAAPTITSNGGGATASISLGENIAAVTTVTATDGDTRQTLTYSISGGADASKFTIDSNTGSLSFTNAPNFEAPTDSGANNIYDVTVRVSDNNGGTDMQAIAVTVRNVNEAPTDLALSANTVVENAPNGTVVGTITGTDSDSGDSKSYTFTNSAGGRFAINRTTGVITVANGTLLNYEAATSHAVTVRVTDRAGLTYDETFTIAVTNVNEAPVGTNATVTINEDTSHTVTVANLGFSDVDAGDSLSAVRIDTLPTAGSLTLSGIAVTAGQVVSVADVTAGNLVFTPAVNANGTGYARFTFSVRDSNTAYDAAPNTLTINVTAVNDAPTDLALSANTVAENAANRTVVGTVTGTDPDIGDTKTYSFVDNAGGRFAINSSTGVITVANSILLNYEAATSHNVTVRVTDRGGLTYNETFTINLSNANEAPTNIVLAGNTVAENSPTGTVVGAASTTDPDAGDRHTYSLTNNAGGRFSIDGTTGQITVANGSLLNYDVAASHTITVRTTDLGGLARSQTFTINLTNINEAPTDLALSASRVAENATNGTVVGTVSGTDPDSGDTKSYSLIDNAGGRFAINAGTGVITVANGSLLDYEAATAHSVIVRVTDAGGLTYDETFSITVTNVNEAPTDLTLSANTVPENAANGTVVGTVTGTDPDIGDTKTYSLTNNAGGRFAINSGTGAITVANSTLLNYEAATSHNVTVRVTDRAGLTYNETFTILVTNVNEAPTGTNATITINEDTSRTITAASFGFSDVDAGDSMSAVRIDTLPTAGTLTLSGVAVTTGQVVSAADLAAGNLAFTPAANANGTGYANFTFSVRDSNNAYDTAPNTLTINVTAVNDAPTDLSLSLSTVAENAVNGTVVGTITGTDPDAGDSKSYTFTNSAGGRFAINRTTGVITVADGSLLNYEAATSHLVTVRVTDSGGLTYDQSFTIQLTDVNEASTGADGTVTINEDTSHTLTTADFGFSDVDAGDSLSAVRIESLPSAGSLTLSGVVVTAGQVITAADLNAGQLVFTPAADASGVGYASLTFTVRDSGNLYAAGPNTLTVDVTPVNDTPVVSANTGATLAEGGTHTIDSGELALTDVDNSAAQLTYSIGTGPTHGCLELVSAPGLAVATFTQADIAANRLVYVHDGSESISDSFTFTVSDGAGGSLGATTVTLTITPVNDAPTIVSDGGGSTAAITVSEHVSAVTIVSGHDVDLPAQALTYSISGGADQALFTIDAATGALRFVAPSNFTAALSASGDHVYVVQVQVVDSQGASATQTLQVTVANVPVTRTVPVLPPSLVPATPSSAPVPPPAVGPGLPVVAGPVVEPGVRPAPADPMPVREVVGPAAQGSIGREGVKTDDLRRPAEWGLRDEPQGRASDQSERVLPVTLSIEPSRLNSEEGRLSPAVLSELLFAKLDAVIEGLEEAVAAETAQQAQVTRIAAASGVTLSVGFVVWALRSTALLASLFATVPAWQMLDPLPVVASHRRERTLRKRAQEQVAREEQVQYRGLHNLLDEQDAKARRSPDA